MLQRYGPIVRLEPNQVAIGDPDLWEEMHRMGSGFRKTPFHEKLRIGPDHMLFSMTDVRQHAARRKLFARALTMDALRRNWEEQVRAKVELGIDQIKKEAGVGVADVHKWWRLLAGDVTALLSFGESFDMLESGGENENERYFAALENAGVSIVLRAVFPPLSFLARVLPWKKLKEIVNANEVITDKGTIAVTNLRATGLGRPNLFSNMLAEAEKVHDGGEREGNVLTDDAIRSEAAGFLLAGSDTTGAALTYVVWAVLKRPDLQRRLEEEVARLSPGFTDKDVEGLSLLNNVVDEVLRLYSPASGSVLRLTPPQGVTWHGCYIPPRTVVITQGWTLVRDETLFPDPERYVSPKGLFVTLSTVPRQLLTLPRSFDETRFENATEKQRRVAQPFGLGTRSCIGISLAKMEMRLATALFFRKCRGVKLSKNMTDDMMQQLMKFFTYPKGNKCEITLVEGLSQ
jgi:cytochrome P450